MATNATPNVILWEQAYARNGDKDLPRASMWALKTYADNNTLECFPTIEQLMKDAGLARRTVIDQLNKNVAAGWLQRVQSGNSHRATTYRLTRPRVQPDSTEGCRVGTVEGAVDCTPTTHTTTYGTTHKVVPLEEIVSQTVRVNGDSNQVYAMEEPAVGGDATCTVEEALRSIDGTVGNAESFAAYHGFDYEYFKAEVGDLYSRQVIEFTSSKSEDLQIRFI